MMWDNVLKAVVEHAVADPLLAELFGESVRLKGSGTRQVPGLELALVSDVEGELWEPCVVQWDIWCHSLTDVRAAERQLRRLFHTELPETFGGVRMFGQYVDGDTLSEPDRDDVYGRAARFRHVPLREVYAGS